MEREFELSVDQYYDQLRKNIEEFAQELDISFQVAAEIIYLKLQGKWTLEKQEELIKRKNETQIV